MTCKKIYECDLCHSNVDASNGIGIRWDYQKISSLYYTNSEHHLCNKCVEGLRAMLDGIDARAAMYRELDATEEVPEVSP